ncbi:MAG: hypothetical protein ACYC9Z_13780 [Casimicrobiaceae bacterium]
MAASAPLRQGIGGVEERSDAYIAVVALISALSTWAMRRTF